jgi:hypothetical protein
MPDLIARDNYFTRNYLGNSEYISGASCGFVHQTSGSTVHIPATRPATRCGSFTVYFYGNCQIYMPPAPADTGSFSQETRDSLADRRLFTNLAHVVSYLS